MRRLLSLWLLVASIGCAKLETRPPISIDATAVIGPSGAQFIFPAESSHTLTYDIPQPRTYAGEPEFIWEVTWDQPDAHVGIHPEALSLVVGRRLGGPRTGPLEAVITRDSVVMLTVCLTCDLADIPESDSHLTAGVLNNRVVFRVRGAETVRRIFPVIPDSVKFVRLHRDPDSETTRSVRVSRRNP